MRPSTPQGTRRIHPDERRAQRTEDGTSVGWHAGKVRDEPVHHPDRDEPERDGNDSFVHEVRLALMSDRGYRTFVLVAARQSVHEALGREPV